MKNDDVKVIVVDADNGYPMSWGGEQFCYVSTISTLSEARSRPFGIKVYTRKEAKRLILEHYNFRIANGYKPLGEFRFVLLNG